MVIFNAHKTAEINGTIFFNVISSAVPGTVIGAITYSAVLGFNAYTLEANSETNIGNAPSLVEALALFSSQPKFYAPAKEVIDIIDITGFSASDIDALLAAYNK